MILATTAVYSWVAYTTAAMGIILTRSVSEAHPPKGRVRPEASLTLRVSISGHRYQTACNSCVNRCRPLTQTNRHVNGCQYTRWFCGLTCSGIRSSDGGDTRRSRHQTRGRASGRPRALARSRSAKTPKPRCSFAASNKTSSTSYSSRPESGFAIWSRRRKPVSRLKIGQHCSVVSR